MKIWILEIGEPLPLEKNVRVQRYGVFTKWLANKGHDVTWWTTSFSHAPKKNFVDQDCEKEIDGVRLKLMYSEGYKRNVSFARIRHNKKYAAYFAKRATRSPKPDLIIAPIPVIEAAFEAVKFGTQYRIPVLLDIRDLWPDELVDLAPKLARPVAKLLLNRAFNQMEYVCSNASGIMGVAQSSVDYGLQFAKRHQNQNDFVFPLGYSGDAVKPEQLANGEAWLKTLNLRKDSFKISFFGTLGRYFDVETVIKAAREIEKEFPIDIIFGGEGSSVPGYKKLAAGLPNLMFPGWLNAGQIAAAMAVSDAGLACYKSDAKMSLPNKPFEYMAGGLPIISSIQGELKGYLKKYNCGLTYRADSVKELVDCIRYLKNNPQQKEQMKLNSRSLLNSHFTMDKVFTNALTHFENICGRRTQQEIVPQVDL